MPKNENNNAKMKVMPFGLAQVILWKMVHTHAHMPDIRALSARAHVHLPYNGFISICVDRQQSNNNKWPTTIRTSDACFFFRFSIQFVFLNVFSSLFVCSVLNIESAHHQPNRYTCIYLHNGTDDITLFCRMSRTRLFSCFLSFSSNAVPVFLHIRMWARAHLWVPSEGVKLQTNLVLISASKNGKSPVRRAGKKLRTNWRRKYIINVSSLRSWTKQRLIDLTAAAVTRDVYMCAPASDLWPFWKNVITARSEDMKILRCDAGPPGLNGRLSNNTWRNEL